MIPHRLMISAFGPYGGEEVIDFDEFEGKGIFLITGDTGAGKTTIFDAITYALFGTLNNKEREAEDFRSHFADPETPTFVQLEFSHNGQDYTIRRSPRQTRPKQRGEGFTDEKPTFSLTSEGMRPLTKKDEVNGKIQEILGISYNQWKQIAMLAQGEFRALLTAKTDDRTDTLRSIFSTKPIQDFQDELGKRAKVIKDEYERAEAKVVESMESIEIPMDSPYRDDLKDKMAIAYVDEVLKVLSLQIGQDSELKNGLEEELKALQGQRDEISKIIGEADNVNKLLDKLDAQKQIQTELASQKDHFDELAISVAEYDDIIRTFEEPVKELSKSKQEAESKEKELESKKSELSKAEEILSKCKEALDSANEKTPQLDALKISISEMEGKKGIYREVEGIRDSIAESEKEYSKASSDLERIQTEKAKFKAFVKEGRDFLDEFEDTGKEIERINTRLEQIKIEEKGIKAIQKKAKEYSDEESKNAKLRRISDEKRTSYAEASEEYSMTEAGFFAASAGRLAQNLEDGRPCPVCGSIHHPNPATVSDDSISEEELADMKASLTSFLDDLNGADGDLRVSSDKLLGILGDIKILCEEQGIEFEDVSKASSICEDHLRILGNEKMEKTSKMKELEPIAEKVEVMREKLKASDDKDREFEEKHLHASLLAEGLKTTIQSLKEKLGEKLEGLTFASLDDLEKEIDRSMKLKESIETSFTKASKEYNEANETANAIKGTVSTLNEQLEAAKESVVQKSDGLKRLMESRVLTEEKVTSVLSDKDGLESRRSKLADYQKKVNDNALLIAQLSESTEGKSRTDLTVMNEQKEAKILECEAKNSEIIEVSLRIGRLEDSGRDIRAAMKKMDEFDRESKDIIRLYEVASGTKGVRMSFESYIQGVYFKRVLAFANQRLQKMTDGRYELLVRKPAKDGNSKIGLDIDVRDNYTGRSRPSDTLSGGESFKAALALALGLSDAVQTMNGGIHIDTLFVDEGFGSLDPESLRQAIDVLHDLSKSNSLIGIISHVDELKEEIDRKIIVSQVDGGLKGSKAIVTLS